MSTSDGTNDGTNDAAPRRGRPRQPYCPDCKKAGKPNVPKQGSSGYCGTHQSLRVKASRRAAEENTTTEKAREVILTEELNEAREEIVELQRLIEEQERSIAELLKDKAPHGPGPDSDGDRYAYPGDPNEQSPLEKAYEELSAYKASVLFLLEWSVPLAQKHDEKLPMQVDVWWQMREQYSS